ncbi:MAG: 50S ribosomal protein L1 [Opitutales bacterium]
MVTLSKRYKQALESADLEKSYSIEEVVGVLAKMPAAKFDETVELSIRLGVDPRQSDQMVRGTVSLPHGSGKTVRVLVFTENAQEALDAGADFAGLEDMLQKVQDGWLDFDVAIATPSAMKSVRTAARVLGPRGLMPNPKSGTVTESIADGIQAVKSGRVEYKMDKTGNLHVIVGKRSFTAEQLAENIQVAVDSVGKARPEALKGRYIKSASISATMSPGIKLNSKEYTKF